MLKYKPVSRKNNPKFIEKAHLFKETGCGQIPIFLEIDAILRSDGALIDTEANETNRQKNFQGDCHENYKYFQYIQAAEGQPAG